MNGFPHNVHPGLPYFILFPEHLWEHIKFFFKMIIFIMATTEDKISSIMKHGSWLKISSSKAMHSNNIKSSTVPHYLTNLIP